MSHAVLTFSLGRNVLGNTPELRGNIYGTDGNGRPDPASHISAGSANPTEVVTEIRGGQLRIHFYGLSPSEMSDTTVSGFETAVTETFSDAVSLGVSEASDPGEESQ